MTPIPTIVHETFVDLADFIGKHSLKGKPFQQVVACAEQQSRFSRISDPDPSRAFFGCRDSIGYGICIEATGSALDRSSSPAKFELKYYRKHQIFRKDDIGFGSDFPPNDLERIFTVAGNNGLDVGVVANALNGIGLPREGLLHMFAGGVVLTDASNGSSYDAFLRVNMRHLPRNAQRPRAELEINAYVSPTLP
ncbi:MAG TPA: hypothetical protein VI612_02795 [Candidatus Nanoarchaeia archaeon]|nr:hypothetical protein [Candidatus Nanoarchaeia archaeon]